MGKKFPALVASGGASGLVRSRSCRSGLLKLNNLRLRYSAPTCAACRVSETANNARRTGPALEAMERFMLRG